MCNPQTPDLSHILSGKESGPHNMLMSNMLWGTSLTPWPAHSNRFLHILLASPYPLNPHHLHLHHLPSPMASLSPLSLILLFLTPSLLLTTPHVQAQSAPSPSPSPLNLTGILDKAGQYTTLIRLLGTTEVGSQITNQLNNSNQGLTLLAPTDNAFNNLKTGTLNGLSQQQQVALLLYHVLPQFYSMESFKTVSNPVRTQATGNDGGLYNLNFTTSANQVNVSTGIVETQINNALRSQPPLAVYQLDVVLLPLDLFGAKPPASAPPPSSTVKKSPSTSAGSSGSPSASENTPANGGGLGRSGGWSLFFGVGLMVLGSVF